MRGEESELKRRCFVRAAYCIGAGLLVVAAARSIHVTNDGGADPVDRVVNESDLHTIRVKTVDLDPTDSSWGKVDQGDFDLIEGETKSIAAQDLPTERPLVLNLLLPAALASADALPARIISFDESSELKSPGPRELKLPDAVVAAGRNRVRAQIERDWLSPGSYRIEIETTERSQPTLRRYEFEVR
jgi:hypothetical protein